MGAAGLVGLLADLLFCRSLDYSLWFLQGLELIFYITCCFLFPYNLLSPLWLISHILGFMIFFRALVVGYLFSCAEIFKSTRPDTMRIGWKKTVKLIFSEFFAFWALFAFLMPFDRFIGEEMPKKGNKVARRDTGFGYKECPIVLIHGYMCNAAFWYPTKRFLLKQGFKNIFVFTLQPPYANIDLYAEMLKRKVSVILNETGHRKVVLIGHSMGGLVARAYVAHCNGASHVFKIITMGTPNHGTKVAEVPPHFIKQGMNCRQMRTDNEWLGQLCESELKMKEQVPVTCVFSFHDSIVCPQKSGVLKMKHVKNVPLTGMGHLAMTFSKTIHKILEKEISEVYSGVTQLPLFMRVGSYKMAPSYLNY